MDSFRIYVADAFAKELYGGNQAGVVLLEEGRDFPSEALMRKIAGEMKHSETAFVKKTGRDAFHIRYFTPAEEVDLCGHATIGAFDVMKQEGVLRPGRFSLKTRAQELVIDVEAEEVWMDMAEPKELYTFSREEAEELYRAYGLEPPEWKAENPAGGQEQSASVCSVSGADVLCPKIVSTGLSDILLPVASHRELEKAVQQEEKVCEISEKYQVVGVHMFCMSKRPGILGECRNFAPLYAIPEEAATGTSNGALTWYLYGYGKVSRGQESVFLQGEAMGKPSLIRSRLIFAGDGETPLVRIGGRALISLKGELFYEG